MLLKRIFKRKAKERHIPIEELTKFIVDHYALNVQRLDYITRYNERIDQRIQWGTVTQQELDDWEFTIREHYEKWVKPLYERN